MPQAQNLEEKWTWMKSKLNDWTEVRCTGSEAGMEFIRVKIIHLEQIEFKGCKQITPQRTLCSILVAHFDKVVMKNVSSYNTFY